MSDEILIPDDLRQSYLERRSKDILTLTHAVQINNFDAFKQIGHQLKGNALTFGYSELAQIAVLMEQAGESQDRDESLKIIESFKAWLAGVHTSSLH